MVCKLHIILPLILAFAISCKSSERPFGEEERFSSLDSVSAAPHTTFLFGIQGDDHTLCWYRVERPLKEIKQRYSHHPTQEQKQYLGEIFSSSEAITETYISENDLDTLAGTGWKTGMAALSIAGQSIRVVSEIQDVPNAERTTVSSLEDVIRSLEDNGKKACPTPETGLSSL